MRRFNTSLILLLFNVLVTAQTLSVESFRLLENDLAANTQGTMMRDQNGDVAALIRVVTSEKGFVFDGGMMGIVGTKQDVGEILLYVPHGIQKITIKHDQLGVLRDYYFPIPIEKARTYEMKLLSGRVKTVVEDEFAAQYVTFRLEPKNAIVYIDGNVFTAQNDGTVSQLLTYGSHEYRVELFGYKTEAGVVQVGSEKILKEVTLQSTMATVTIQCAMEEADIYVNDEKKGQGSWSGQLAPGLYKVEAKREGYQTRLVSLTVSEFEEKTVSVPEPLEIFGRIRIQSDPIDATVYIDGVEVGTTPMISEEIRAGAHMLELRKESYKNYRAQFFIEDASVVPMDIQLVSGESRNTPVIAIKAEESATVEKEKTPKIIAEKEKPIKTTSKTKRFFESTNYYFGAFILPESGVPNESFTLWSYTNFQAGVFYKDFNVELNYTTGIDCPDGISGYWIMTPEDLNGDGVQEGTKSYSYCYKVNSTQFNIRFGYGVRPLSRLRITPQVGIMYQGLSCDWDDSTEVFGGDPSKKTHVICASLDAKIEFSPLQHVSLFYTAGYNIPVKMGQIASKLNENEQAVSKGLSGLYQNMGFTIYF